MYDYLIVGAGFSGAACARLLADKGKRVLVIDRRNHVAGNAYDEVHDCGLLYHVYGPHIFHTVHQEVWQFLSRFTKWHDYQHRVKAYVNGQYVPMPINLDTINQLFGTNYTSENLEQEFYAKVRQDISVHNARDMVISKVGETLYDLFFKNYTKKQWAVYPEELAPEVTARIPIRTNRDDRYFSDPYQGMPEQGYTSLVKNMLQHDLIHVLLQADFQTVKNEIAYERLIYTGPIDEYFDYCFGPLPYRSVQFELEVKDEGQSQAAPVVNYPNDYDFTRITEYKSLTGQKSSFTLLAKEFSSGSGDPYYPVPRAENKVLYEKYQEKAGTLERVWFLGRLGRYEYANMDKVVLAAMNLMKEIEE